MTIQQWGTHTCRTVHPHSISFINFICSHRPSAGGQTRFALIRVCGDNSAIHFFFTLRLTIDAARAFKLIGKEKTRLICLERAVRPNTTICPWPLALYISEESTHWKSLWFLSDVNRLFRSQCNETDQTIVSSLKRITFLFNSCAVWPGARPMWWDTATRKRETVADLLW